MQPISTDPTGLQLLTNKAKLAFFTYDVAANQFTYLNPAFEQLFKVTTESTMKPEDLLKMVLSEDQQHVVETYHELLKRELRGGGRVSYTVAGAGRAVGVPDALPVRRCARAAANCRLCGGHHRIKAVQ